MLRPAIVTSVLSVLAAWMLLLVDPSDNDGAAGSLMAFGAPALCIAVLCVFFFSRYQQISKGSWRWLWWPLCVMPVGVLAAVAVSVLRDPEYYIGDESPWMLLWMPVFVVVAMLLGTIVAAFWLGPVVFLIATVVAVIRKQVKPSMLVVPLGWLAVGALTLIGAASVAPDGVGRLAYGNIALAFFGLPGGYTVTWEPGLWIVRAIVLALVLLFGIPAWRERHAGNRTSGADDAQGADLERPQ